MNGLRWGILRPILRLSVEPRESNCSVLPVAVFGGKCVTRDLRNFQSYSGGRNLYLSC